MTQQVRWRIDKRLVKDAAKVCAEIGLTPPRAVSLFLVQLVKLHGLPFRPSEFPVLEEYGATLAEADAAEEAALAEIAADRKAGRIVEFTGKLIR
jgi:addiction module RelB/DinJ family antitoxin